MPTYEYQCMQCSAWQQAFRTYTNRDTDTPACLDCSGDTRRGIWGATAESKPLPSSTSQDVEMYTKPAGLLDAATGRRYRLSDLQCKADDCGHLEDTTECWLDGDGETAELNPVCPKCGGPAEWEAINPGHSRFSEAFPYYDMGAGRWFRNKRERREWMHVNGIEEAGDLSRPIDSFLRKDDDEDRKVLNDYNSLRDLYRHDPEMKKVYRQLEDEGKALPDLQ